MILLLVSVAAGGVVIGLLVGALGLIMVRMATPSRADDVEVDRTLPLLDAARDAA